MLTAVRAGDFVLPRQRDHRIDLTQQLVGGLFQLLKIEPQIALVIPVHILDQQLAVTFDGVQRRSQVVAEPPVKILERLSILEI